MKFRIGYKIFLFALLLVALAAGVVLAAIRSSTEYVVYREYIDLQDESVSRGREILEQIGEAADVVRALAVGRVESSDTAPGETAQPAPAGAAQPAPAPAAAAAA
ncbi:MAG TPA: hypothetical protein VML55_04495, partial [Planctomycetaceae bacterium]|nr:hypothetical protein [Planctomycetaceae bacterium]